MKQIQIGDRELRTISDQELHELLKVDGLFMNSNIYDEPSPWHDPVIWESHWVGTTLWFSGEQVRKEDNKKIKFEGYLDFDRFRVFYENSVRQSTYTSYLRLDSFNWLIEKGFNLPLSTYSK